MRKLKRGFTIIELVIVIAVIAILTAVLVPTFISLSKKAGDSNDKTIVKNANIQLAAQESLEGKNKSMSEAVKDVDEIGYHMSSVPTSNGNKIVWDQTTDRFVLLDKNNNVLLSDGNVSGHNKLFLAVSNLENIGDFAIYAKSDYSGTTEFTSAKSFDAGDKEDITSISYVFDGSGAVLVATNSQETEVTVNTPNAEFAHTGLSKKILITAVANDTFKDFGHVGYIEINAGHYVADEGANIKAVYATSADAKVDIQNGGKIEKAYGGAETYTGDNSKGNVELDFNDNKAAVEEQALEDLDHDVNPGPQLIGNPISSEAELASAFALGGEYYLVSNITIENGGFSKTSNDFTLDLNGKTITIAETAQLDEAFCIMSTGAALVFNDNAGGGKILYASATPHADALVGVFGDGTITLNGGTYLSASDQIFGGVTNRECFFINGGQVLGYFGELVGTIVMACETSIECHSDFMPWSIMGKVKAADGYTVIKTGNEDVERYTCTKN